MNTGNMARSVLIGLGSFLVFVSSNANAATCEGEVIEAGTVINAENIDSVLTKCFDNHRIGDVMGDRVEWQVRNQGMTLRLTPYEPLLPGYRKRMVTEKFKGTVTLDPSSFDITNWVAGAPFPDVDVDDPNAAVKVVWNHRNLPATLGANTGGASGLLDPNFAYMLIDGTNGIDRIQRWNFTRVHMSGRYTSIDGPHSLGDGTVFHKTMLFATYPHDVKGLGTFTINYTTPRYNDTWAYIRTVRRIRRLSGGAWVDPIGGTDQLQDDLNFAAHPTWYAGYKLLGRAWVLAVAESEASRPGSRAAWDPEGATIPERFPLSQLDQAPYWNVEDDWMPRDVFIVEAIPPAFHPYSRRVIYFDAENWSFLHANAYDRKGDYWKWVQFGWKMFESQDGFIDPDTGKAEVAPLTNWGRITDFQRLHSTNFFVPKEFQTNIPGIETDDVTLTALEAAGR